MRYTPKTYYYLLMLGGLLLGLASCIGEGSEDCTQAAVSTQLVDASGNVLSDSVVKYRKAYLFLNNKFDHTVTAEADGRYLLSFDSSLGAKLVIAGVSDIDSIGVNTPSEGLSIDSIWLKALPTSDGRGYMLPHLTYYGCNSYGQSSSKASSRASTQDGVLTMYNQCATLHVAVENLKANSGTYSIQVTGLYDALTYGGTVTGNAITYTPTVSYKSDGTLVTEGMMALPTPSGGGVTVTVYQNGKEYYTVSKTDGGSNITLSGGEDKTIVISMGYAGITVSVMPWAAYISQHSTI